MNEYAIWAPVFLTPTLTFAVVALGLFQQNKRIEDMRDLLRAEFKSEICPLRVEVGANAG